MRADAARNLTAVLRAGARLLAEDPGTSMAAIAAAAGVDRTTVHRRFASREALLSAVFQAKLDSAEQVLDEARLTEAPVPVALHRYVEGIVPVSRQWPVDTRRMMQKDPVASARREEQSARLDAFVRRAVDEGHLRAGTDPQWARAVLDGLVDAAAHQFPGMEAPQAADLVTATLLGGLGTA
ncbi:TetR/AcrR family transcriptional regulator [Streptomyces thermodiastaticus]|jgi:AcrR family transcriptional regulator|uniref:TetR/AcrR family transcriptional regulator n=1 Tax=Streptomyces thermodiastaticus TaxID=44061 RepID=UPI001677544D|nr:TetR family transcriptional regulator [Streptomyces thermodiastaticus]MCE7553280.1 TetR family transcriptional regulator [Streptomyces thermodiastaticus]